MLDEKLILRQRRRENLFELLELLADEKKQIEYGQLVGDSVAVDELQCMWFDGQYHGDQSAWYDSDELTALKKFNDFYDSIPRTVFGDNIKELTEKKEWIELIKLARVTLNQMKRA